MMTAMPWASRLLMYGIVIRSPVAYARSIAAWSTRARGEGNASRSGRPMTSKPAKSTIAGLAQTMTCCGPSCTAARSVRRCNPMAASPTLATSGSWRRTSGLIPQMVRHPGRALGLGITLYCLLLVGCTAPTAPSDTTPDSAVVGSGKVTFGAAYDPETLEVTQATDRFRASRSSIAWSAEFSEQAGATKLLLVLARVGSGGSEELLYSEEITIANPQFGILANEADLASIAGNEPGTYVLRYLRDTTVLAEGTFELV